MDSWFSYIVYHRWIYSYSSRSCYNYSFDKSNYREKGTLIKVSENVENGKEKVDKLIKDDKTKLKERKEYYYVNQS